MSNIGLTLHHVPVGVVRDGVDVRRDLMALFAFVHFNDLLRVDRQHFIRVHHHAKQPRVCLKKNKRHLSFPLYMNPSGKEQHGDTAARLGTAQRKSGSSLCTLNHNIWKHTVRDAYSMRKTQHISRAKLSLANGLLPKQRANMVLSYITQHSWAMPGSSFFSFSALNSVNHHCLFKLNDCQCKNIYIFAFFRPLESYL